MRKLKVLWLCLALSALCLAAVQPSATDDASRIIQVAMLPSPLESNLRHLTDESVAFKKASNYASNREAIELIAQGKRAQDKLGIKPSKNSMTSGWTWSLPEGAHQNTKMLTPERLSTFGNHEHLRGESVVVTNDLGDAVTDGWKDEL